MKTETFYLPAVVNRANWGDFFTETAVWQPVVERICRATAVTPANHISAGYPGSCAVFVVDAVVVVKLYPPMFAADFKRERAVYSVLDGDDDGNGRLPYLLRLLATGVYQNRIDWPYLIIQFCPGDPIRERVGELNQADKIRLGTELGRMLRILHDTPLQNEKLWSANWSTWTDFLQENLQRLLTKLAGTHPQLGIEVELFLREMEDVWLLERPLHLINADLTEDHLLLVKKDSQWQISALIDWADAEIGVVEYEWVALWFGLCGQDKNLFEAILSTYNPVLKLDEFFQRRLWVYMLLHCFNYEILTEL